MILYSFNWCDSLCRCSCNHLFKTLVGAKPARAFAAILLGILLVVAQPQVASAANAAVNQSLKKGIKLYHKGDYKNAAGMLLAAINTEFNNAVLHYYLANCYSQQGKDKAAIREFRIAYALEPDTDVGKYSKQALVALGAMESEPAAQVAKPDLPPEPPPKTEAEKRLERTVSSLRDQASGAASHSDRWNSIQAGHAARNKTNMIRKEQERMIRSMMGSGRRLKFSKSQRKQLNDLRRQFESRERQQAMSGRKHTSNIRQSSENLERLLIEGGSRRNSTGIKLVPEGTNLYIRNYRPVD